MATTCSKCAKCKQAVSPGQLCRLAPVNRWLCPMPNDKGKITASKTTLQQKAA